MDAQEFLAKAKQLDPSAYNVDLATYEEEEDEPAFSCAWVFLCDFGYVHAVAYEGTQEHCIQMCLELLQKPCTGKRELDLWTFPDGTVTDNEHVNAEWVRVHNALKK